MNASNGPLPLEWMSRAVSVSLVILLAACASTPDDSADAPSPEACEPGQAFDADDGCNTCTCPESGLKNEAPCTEMDCQAYDPCADKACGDTCDPCPPTNDGNCTPTEEAKACNADLECQTMMLVTCADPEPGATWYEHPCGNGDPMVIECVTEADTLWEDPSTSLCSDLEVAAGDPCEDLDTQCVLTQGFSCASMDRGPHSSEAFLTCRNTPFEDGPCPASSREVKRDIRYIAPMERQQLAREVLDVKLARYHYRDAAKPGQKLGYILEDHPEATFSGDGRVDLYAYVSALVALSQEQQIEINRLKEQLEMLKGGR